MGSGKLHWRATAWVAAICTTYLVLAYIVAPEFWSLRFLRGDTTIPEMVTRTPQGIPGDPINVGLVGTENSLIAAFAAAGWDRADSLSFKSDVEIGESVLFDRPDKDAPVSTLLFEGRKQDLAFEKPVGNSADQRHHVRLWRSSRTGKDGRPLWLGSTSFDRGVGLSHDTGEVTHHIAPDIDAERDFVIAQLFDASQIVSISEIPGVGPTMTGRNGGGDPYFTDGQAIIGVLRAAP